MKAVFCTIVLLGLFLVAGCPNGTQAPGRYAYMETGGDGLMVLDTQTGAIWVCAPGMETGSKKEKWTLFATSIPVGLGRPSRD
jgi:hypothetical protein